MCPNAQRIAIAEACGWVQIEQEVDWLPNYITGVFTQSHPTKEDHIKVWVSRREVPDFLNNLDDMHYAEKTLCREGIIQQEYWQSGYGRYISILSEMTIHPISATAAQRAEAFLRTKGLWVEDDKQTPATNAHT